MTLSVSQQVSPVGSKIVVQTVANATANNDVTGTTGSIYQVEIDNTANSDNAAYLKIYDNASPVVGTTAPDFIFKCPINQRINIAVIGGLSFTNLSFAVVISGGTSGVTNPTNPVIVKMVTT